MPVVTHPIASYALLSDMNSAALVSARGSIDWLCLPRFDAPSCFARLLGGPEHGSFSIAPRDEIKATSRRYVEGTLVLETTFETESGKVVLVDAMLPHTDEPDLVRLVKGVEGQVPMRAELRLRFDYGRVLPWVRRKGRGLSAVAGPDAVALDTTVSMKGEGLSSVAEFTVGPGDIAPFAMVWHPSHTPTPGSIDAVEAIEAAVAFWRDFGARGSYAGPHAEAVQSALVAIKALTYAPTGAIAASPSLVPGADSDGRHCVLREAARAMRALLRCGYRDEARAFRDYLLRAVAGDPSLVQPTYGLSGERRGAREHLSWLSSREAPVVAGLGDPSPGGLDTYGGVLDALHLFAGGEGVLEAAEPQLVLALARHVRGAVDALDDAVSTHELLMGWVALGRARTFAAPLGDRGPEASLAQAQQRLGDRIVATRVGPSGALVSSPSDQRVDPRLLLSPLVGFLPADHPVVKATTQAVQQERMCDGLVEADRSGAGSVSRSCWLVECLALTGQPAEASALFERLLSLRNDVGLLCDEHAGDQATGAPSLEPHVALVNAALQLARTSR